MTRVIVRKSVFPSILTTDLLPGKARKDHLIENIAVQELGFDSNCRFAGKWICDAGNRSSSIWILSTHLKVKGDAAIEDPLRRSEGFEPVRL